jgi:hypothetical protein
MAIYKVWLRSKPGPYEQYDGFIRVEAKDREDAVEKAFFRLERGAFYDRNRGMWNVYEVQYMNPDRLYGGFNDDQIEE